MSEWLEENTIAGWPGTYWLKQDVVLCDMSDPFYILEESRRLYKERAALYEELSKEKSLPSTSRADKDDIEKRPTTFLNEKRNKKNSIPRETTTVGSEIAERLKKDIDKIETQIAINRAVIYRNKDLDGLY